MLTHDTNIFDTYLPDICQSQLHHLWEHYHSRQQPNHNEGTSSGSSRYSDRCDDLSHQISPAHIVG